MSAIEQNQSRQPEEDSGDPYATDFVRLKREIIDAHRARGFWYKEAKRAFDFVAGYQWDETDKALLDSQNRPAIVFNRTAPLVKAVCGLEVNNRQAVIYLPRTVEDTGPTDMITATAKWVRDECNAEDEESEAFRDLVICGEGWSETRMDFDDDPAGKIVKERIEPLEMGVNKGAFRANYSDARMIYRVREMAPDDVKALLALPDDIEDAALDASVWLPDQLGTPADGGRGNKRDYPRKTREGVRKGKLDTVTIVQCQYWVREPVHMVASQQDEQMIAMSPEDFTKFEERAGQLGMQFEHVQSMRKKYYQCFIGVKILKLEPMEMDDFQFKAMTGERDKKEKCFYGMVRDMFDPQMWSNKWLSQTMHIMNSNAKGGLLAETDAFLNQRTAQKNWSDPTKIIWVKPGSLQKQKVKERQAVPLPPGLDQLMMFAISSIRDVTGINLELLGQADREQAASLEAQRRQSAMTILATMFDSLRKYRKNDGRLLLHFIWLLPEGTLVRVVEQGEVQYVPLIKNGKDMEKYDIIIDEAPSSPDQKQFVWGITQQILQMNILPPPAIIELLKYSPYPESVVQEIRKAMGVDGEMPPEQLQQKLQQAEQALQWLEQQLHEAQAKAKTAEDDRAVELLKLEVDEYKAETDRLRAQWDARIKASGQMLDDANAAEDRVVNTGTQSLPDVGGGQTSPAAPQNGALEQKVDALAQMIQQLIQSMGQQQAPASPPAPDQPLQGEEGAL